MYGLLPLNQIRLSKYLEKTFIENEKTGASLVKTDYLANNIKIIIIILSIMLILVLPMQFSFAENDLFRDRSIPFVKEFRTDTNGSVHYPAYHHRCSWTYVLFSFCGRAVLSVSDRVHYI